MERPNILACIAEVFSRGDDEHVVQLTAGLGTLLNTDGPWPEAIELVNASREAARRAGMKRAEAHALFQLGFLNRLQGDPAVETLERAWTLYDEIGDIQGAANSLVELGYA